VRRLAACLIVLANGVLPLSGAPAVAEKDSDSRIRWLAANAIVLRSIEPGNEDFADLEPLRQAVGDARIVQLGEQSHGDGATFHAKTRLIKFLHQKLDFDTLAFTAADGEAKIPWFAKGWPIEPPLTGSIEDLLVRAGCTNAIVDFRHLAADGKWLQEPLAARPMGYQYLVGNWTDVFDGIVFTKTMYGSTFCPIQP
jgi:erythromycin esterase-like protein